MKETWTDIPGLEGKYKISNMGRYKRLSRYIQGRRLPEEILPLNQSQVTAPLDRLSISTPRSESHPFNCDTEFGFSSPVTS